MARNKKNWDYLVDYYGNYRSVLGAGQKGEPGPVGTGTQGIQGIQVPKVPQVQQGLRVQRVLLTAMLLSSKGKSLTKPHCQQLATQLVTLG